MLAISALRERLRSLTVPVVAVSPIVAGEAVKGPTAKIMRELQVQPSASVIAELYADFVDIVIVDSSDATLVAGDRRFAVAPTVMKTLEHKTALARECLALIDTLRAKS
jgi:LPPG:FO 2-phospho-L-lactate transferase